MLIIPINQASRCQWCDTPKLDCRILKYDNGKELRLCKHCIRSVSLIEKLIVEQEQTPED